MKMKFLIYFFVISLVFSINVDAATLNSCSIAAICNSPDISLFKVDGSSNAHSELNSQTSYNFNVCCSGSNLNNIKSTTSYNILNLSDITNAHVAYDTTYNSNPTYLGTTDSDFVNCNYNSVSNCVSGEVCVVTVSGSSNAHVADCSSPNAYQTKVCCKIASSPQPPIPQCKFIESYWMNSTFRYVPGNNLEWDNEQISALIIGENCDGKDVQFTVYESDCNPVDGVSVTPTGTVSCTGIGNLNQRSSATMQFVLGSGIAQYLWTTAYEIDEDGDDPEFYFVANLSGVSSPQTPQANLSQMVRVKNLPNPNGVGPGGSTCNNGVWEQSKGELCDITDTSVQRGGCQSSFNCIQCQCMRAGSNTITTTTPCNDDGNGDKFGSRIENITSYDRTIALGQPGYVISSSLVTKTCLLTGSLKVPFFGWINALVVIVLLTIFYLARHKKNK